MRVDHGVSHGRENVDTSSLSWRAMSVKSPCNYPFRVDPFGSGGWIVWFPDLPGCSGRAEMWGDIGLVAQDVVKAWLSVHEKKGEPIPVASVVNGDSRWA